MQRSTRWALGIGATLLLLAVGTLLALHVASLRVREALLSVFGPGSEVRSVEVGFASLSVEGLRIPGGPGWPAPDALRAERVVIVPALRTLLTDRIEISSMTVTQPYLVVYRPKKGRLRVLPRAQEKEGAKESPPRPREPAPDATAESEPETKRVVVIDRIDLEDGSIDYYDASISKPPWMIRLESAQATFRNVRVPAFDEKLELDFAATLKGKQRDGHVELVGWRDGASKDLETKLTLREVDVLALEPYLVRAIDAPLSGGTLDLDLDSKVKNKQLYAPGRIVLANLAFARGRDAVDTVMGIPRAAVTKALAGKHDRIELHFTLEGNLDDPHFSLNEVLATRIAVAFAETLGLGVKGLAEVVEGAGRGGLEGAGEAVKSVGSALKKLLGGSDEEKR